VGHELKLCKRAIRVFLRTAYTDERLAWLLAHARSGRLVYYSCCCLVGVTTAEHPLAGRISPVELRNSGHYALARTLLGASEAERDFYHLGLIAKQGRLSSDELRRRRLIPMVLAEQRRRSQVSARALAHPQETPVFEPEAGVPMFVKAI